MPNQLGHTSSVGENYRKFKKIIIAYCIALVYYAAVAWYFHLNRLTFPDTTVTPIGDYAYYMLGWMHVYVLDILFIALYIARLTFILLGKFDKTIYLLPMIDPIWLIILIALMYAFVDKSNTSIITIVEMWFINYSFEWISMTLICLYVFLFYNQYLESQRT